jgi:phage terminase large subunit-like protein
MATPSRRKPRKTTPDSSSATTDAATSPTERYARAVVAGQLPACKWVKLACQRHLTDLAGGAARGLYFDPEAEARIITFYTYLRHSKGEWAGQSFELSLWQQFILGSLHGWKRADKLRRFRTAYVEVPRKNGKSTLLGGASLYALTADGEPGAEVYAAATKKDQARIVFNEAKAMVLASDELRKRVRTFKDNLNVPASGSKFEPLASDGGTLDGLNIHLAANDELHAWKDRDLYDVIETAMGARRQPLMFNITTAGKNPQGICYELREYAESVLQGIVKDDSFFAYIATIDKEDLARWDDPEVWKKANPNFGVSVKPDDLERLATKARILPRARAAFLRLRLNVWTFGIDTWLPLERWRQGGTPIDMTTLHGRSCFAALDLSSTTDLSALALVFPPPDFDPAEVERVIKAADPDDDGEDDQAQINLDFLKDWIVVWRFYMPSANIADRMETDRVDYQQWVADGLITPTEGNVVDYDYIRRDINALGEQVNILEVAIDRWAATHMMTLLGKDGFTVVPFGQGYASMSAPSKFLEGLVFSGHLLHGGNAVADWMSQNVVVAEDEARNIKPVKRKSTGRIDGIVSLIMALGRAIVPKDEVKKDEPFEYTGM